MSLVSTDWVEKNINNIKIIDCSWHMPNVKRDGYKEYLKEHIENAIFFDLDKNSDQILICHICLLLQVIGKKLFQNGNI